MNDRTVTDILTAAPMQRKCGWCATELAPGTQPATTGICPRCFIRLEADGRRPQKGVV